MWGGNALNPRSVALRHVEGGYGEISVSGLTPPALHPRS